MLSAKRCGSTALFRLFQRHPDVGVCHVDPTIPLWEPNFWNLAHDAIQGRPEAFVARFAESHPFLEMPARFDEAAVFGLWDRILEVQGPIVFDKSPQYLASPGGLELLGRYRERGHDVRVFAFIRDPRDAITSQYERWRRTVPDDSPERRERRWLEAYANLARFRERVEPLPLYRYEDFAARPEVHAPALLAHCGLPDHPEAWAHVRPTSLGRYSASILPSIRRWRFTPELRAHLREHGYPEPQLPPLARARLLAGMLPSALAREWRQARSLERRQARPRAAAD
jgi:hypothetical protein